MTAWYIGLLYVEELFILLRCTIFIADETVHSNLEQPVDSLEVFSVLLIYKTVHFIKLFHSLIMGQ